MSLLFIVIGFIVTENNAKSLLSGYNTMSEEDRKLFDLKSYILYFKNFHIFLGLSFLVFGTFFAYFINENIAGFFLAVYPILAYIYFIWSGVKYSKVSNNRLTKIGIITLIIVLIFVIFLFLIEFNYLK